MNVCPVKALSRDESLARVMVDYDKCIGCRSCVAVCPFGAMNFNVIDRKVFKCDLCDGDPQCVRFCDMKAVDYKDATDVSILKKRELQRGLAWPAKRVPPSWRRSRPASFIQRGFRPRPKPLFLTGQHPLTAGVLPGDPISFDT